MSDEKKPLIMVFPMELASHYLRCIALCKRLKASFRVEVADSKVYRQFIDEAGLDTFEVARFRFEEIRDAVANFDFSWLNRQRLTEIMESQVEVITERRPHAVLGDTSFTLKMAAEKTGTRFISLLNGYMTKFYGLQREVPRDHPGYQYSKKLPPKFFERIAKIMEYRSLKAVHEPFRRIRDDCGLRQTQYLLDELEGDLNLVCDLPEFFPLQGAPPSYNYIGPLYYSGKSEETEILALLDGSRPNILVTMGSSGEWKKLSFLEEGVFRKYRFILSGNGNGTIDIPDSICRPFINHVSILPRIELVICHGGNGTIYQALSAGVPVLSVPGNFESEWNSNRIQNLGLGEVMESNYTAESIDHMMQSWISKRGSKTFQDIRRQILAYQSLPVNIN